MAEAGLTFDNGLANQFDDRRDPRQVVICAHRSAHKDKSAVAFGIWWYCRALVQLEERPRNRMPIQKAGKIAGSVLGRKTKNGDWFHRFYACRDSAF